MFILNICNNQTIKNIHAAAIINSEIAASNAYYAYMYAKYVLTNPFPLGELTISKSDTYSYWYAFDVLKGPFPLGESVIANDIFYSKEYTKDVLKRDFYLNDILICKYVEE